MKGRKLRIAIADDHHIVRDSLGELLRRRMSADVVLSVSNGKELIDQIAFQDLDIILLDVNMPVLDGVDTLKVLKSRNPGIKVIVLTMYDDESLMLKLVRLKVNGFIMKDCSSRELIKAIREVEKNGFYFNQKIARAMFNKTSGINKKKVKESYFVPNDLDESIMRMLCEQKTVNEMADVLSLSPRTIEGRKKRMMEKLQLKKEIGLVVYAIKRGYAKV